MKKEVPHIIRVDRKLPTVKLKISFKTSVIKILLL